MEYKILESIGVENENIDGGAFNNFAASGQSGIIEGVLNDCDVIVLNNSITINTGVLLLKGIRVKIEEPITLTLNGSPATVTSYQLIARIILNMDRSVAFSVFARNITTLTQDELYRNNEGMYEFEIASFYQATSGELVLVKKAKGISNINEEKVAKMIDDAIGKALTGDY